MLWGEAGRSMHETVWKSPLIQDFPAWANWWNSSWNTGNHFTRQTFLKAETSVACPLTQRCCINASRAHAILCLMAVFQVCLGRNWQEVASNSLLHLFFVFCFFWTAHGVSPCRNSSFIQWIMSTHHEGHINLYTLRSHCQHHKTTNLLTSAAI